MLMMVLCERWGRVYAVWISVGSVHEGRAFRVIEIKEDNTAVVEVFGARRLISLDLLLEELGAGEWVLVHVGVAIHKLDPVYALESLRLFEELLEEENEP